MKTKKEKFIIDLRERPVKSVLEACRIFHVSRYMVRKWMREDKLFEREIYELVTIKKPTSSGRGFLFKKGNSGNPKGRPKRTSSELSLIRIEKWRARKSYVEKPVSESYAINQGRKLKAYVKYCELCGGYKNLEVHHKDRDRRNYKVDNLLKACKKCHVGIHVKAGDWGNSKQKSLEKTLIKLR